MFYTNGTGKERMRILASGNVAIGSASPVQLLDVNGNINITNNSWNGINNARV